MIIDVTCEDLSPFLGILKNGIFPIIQFAVPIILIVLGTIDFVKVVASGDEKVSKEATADFARRILYGVAVFFVPILINLIFGMFKETDDSDLENINFFECWNYIDSIGGISSPETCFDTGCSANEVCLNDTSRECKNNDHSCECVSDSYTFDDGTNNCYGVMAENSVGFKLRTALTEFPLVGGDSIVMCCPFNDDEFFNNDVRNCKNPK